MPRLGDGDRVAVMSSPVQDLDSRWAAVVHRDHVRTAPSCTRFARPAFIAARRAGATIRYVVETCSLGQVLIAATERGVCAVLLGDNVESLVEDLAQRFPSGGRVTGGVEMAELVSAVLRLVDDPTVPIRLPLDLYGSAFQLRVWEALTRIPVGRTVSYAELAAMVAAPSAARAVARASASNHVAIVIPCHRVIRGDGKLSGYRWGIERKRELLERERRAKAER
jgi:AraC family transcriptional regulator, regulatory protein of adaptative response / methylated-DNA-[protein]-cysteine methyltransferase